MLKLLYKISNYATGSLQPLYNYSLNVYSVTLTLNNVKYKNFIT